MKNRSTTTTAILLAAAAVATAAPEKAGDLRINSGTYPDRFYHFDTGFSETTRGVPDAPVQLTSTFSGTTQNASSTGDAATDIGIRTYDDDTVLKNLNRYASDADGPGPLGGAQRLGCVQFAIDLSPVETYLTDTGETLTELDIELDFLLQSTAQSAPYDIYLTYTNGAEGITLTPISGDPAWNYENLWWPAQAGAVDDVINGTHKIVNLAQLGDLTQTVDLLATYNAGVRQVNLIIAVPSFFSGRTFALTQFGGIFVNTDGLGSPTQVGDLRLNPATFANNFFHADTLGPISTRPMSLAPFDLPSVLTAISQNQGGNPPTGPICYIDLDGVAGDDLNSPADGSSATVVGYGAGGIGTGTADAFQFTALKWSGDFDIQVQLDSLTSTQTGARAGLMVRDSAAAGAAHVFLGVQQTGEPVVVVRDTADAAATETIGGTVSLPQTLRIKRTGDLFSFYLSANDDTPAPDPDATVVLTDPVFLGFVATNTNASVAPADSATAVFSKSSFKLPNPGKQPAPTDIAIRTYTSATTVRTLTRYGGNPTVGAIQWAIDLTPLDAYLADNSRTLESLSLALVADTSDDTLPQSLDVYLWYTNPAEDITLAGIDPDLPTLNYQNFLEPALAGGEGDIVNGTHKVLLSQHEGDISLSEDLLALYQAGVREFNLIITTDTFYADRNIAIGADSGIFIETSVVASPRITSVLLELASNEMTLDLDGLTGGNTYHLASSIDLESFAPIPGSEFVAADTTDIVTTTVTPTVDPKLFIRVVEGPLP